MNLETEYIIPDSAKGWSASTIEEWFDDVYGNLDSYDMPMLVIHDTDRIVMEQLGKDVQQNLRNSLKSRVALYYGFKDIASFKKWFLTSMEDFNEENTWYAPTGFKESGTAIGALFPGSRMV